MIIRDKVCTAIELLVSTMYVYVRVVFLLQRWDLLSDLQAAQPESFQVVPRPRLGSSLTLRGLLCPLKSHEQVPALFHQRGAAWLCPLLWGKAEENDHEWNQTPTTILAGTSGMFLHMYMYMIIMPSEAMRVDQSTSIILSMHHNYFDITTNEQIWLNGKALCMITSSINY